MRTESGGRETGRDGEHERVTENRDTERERDRQAWRRKEGMGGISIQRQSVVFQAAAAVKIGERKNNDGLKD